jgi:hypothetical protein
MCRSHWQRWNATGVVPTTLLKPYRQKCSVEGCARPHLAKGWCEYHGDRVKSHGDPLTRGRPWMYGKQKDGAVAIRSAHLRVERARGKARDHACAHCGGQAADWAYDWSDPDALTAPVGSLYSLDPSHYMPLCKRCHSALDRPHRKIS